LQISLPSTQCVFGLRRIIYWKLDVAG
jgi:hypothetical protein